MIVGGMLAILHFCLDHLLYRVRIVARVVAWDSKRDWIKGEEVKLKRFWCLKHNSAQNLADLSLKMVA